jgi:FAD/FMN-containing dehydrogenase
MSRTDADVAAMRALKTAFDPHGYLNPAVLFS